jgi:hypothetical protein
LSNVLVLNWFPKSQQMRQSVWQHQHALDGGPDQVVYHNAADDAPRWLRALPWDAVLLHTVFLCARWVDEFPIFRRRFAWIADLRCPKIAIPQDEYDHSDVLDEWLEELGTTHILSCFGADAYPELYPRMHRRAEFHRVLTGYIDRRTAEAQARTIRPLSDRPKDIVYRALRLPYWFGSHGASKHRIADVVDEHARRRGLATDISTRWEDTIYSGWLEFLASSRATIGVESGSSVLDRRGEIRAQIGGLLRGNPEATFDEVDTRLPPGWDSYHFFAVSPRHLEAVVTKTAQILVRGSYSDVLEPDAHYIPLDANFGNVEEALDTLEDDKAVQAMIDRAYDEIYRSGRYDLERYAELLRSLFAGSASHRIPASAVQRVDELQGAARDTRARGVRSASRAARAGARAAVGLRPSEHRGGLPGRGSVVPQLRRAEMAARAALRTSARRRLILGYITHRRWREVAPRELLRDAVRLAALDAAVRAGARTEIVRMGDAIVITTEGVAPSRASVDPGLYWDNQTGVDAGGDGMYRFAALSTLVPTAAAARVLGSG